MIQYHTALTQLLNQLVAAWDEQVFVSMLPELRFSFAQLKPKQTAQLAEQLASWNGLSSQDLLHHATALSQTELLEGTALNAQLLQALQQDGLWHWLNEPASIQEGSAQA